MITVSKVSKWYPNFQVLKHCSTEVAKGEVVVVCGPSGFFARTALAARSLETIHFGPEYCGRALPPEEGGEWGDRNERTGDEASSRRERSETTDGRSNPDHRRGSASRGEGILQARGGHNRARIYHAQERVLMRFQGIKKLQKFLSRAVPIGQPGDFRHTPSREARSGDVCREAYSWPTRRPEREPAHPTRITILPKCAPEAMCR